MPSSSEISRRIFTRLRDDIHNLVINSNDEEREDDLFLTWCDKIKDLSLDEFREFEGDLASYLINDWEKLTNCCFKSLRFATDLIVYICTIANLPILEEHVTWFSQSSMPPHVQLIVYPAILTVANQKRPNDFVNENETFMSRFETYMFKLSQETQPIAELTSTPIATEFIAFWGGAIKFLTTCGSCEFEKKILSGFSSCHLYLQTFCESFGHRKTIMVALFLSLQGKPRPVKDTSILLCTLFLLYTQSIKYNPRSWQGVCTFIEKLYTVVSKSENNELQEFVSKVIESFLQHAHVNSESMITDLENKLIFTSTAKNNSTRHTPPETSTSLNGPLVNGQQNPKSSQAGTSDSILRPSVKSGINGINNSDKNNCSTTEDQKFLNLLDQLVGTMQAKAFKAKTDSDKERIKQHIANLNGFL